MYRRRHHCRMCGQVFCNQCSSYYIEGEAIGLVGPARTCRLCYNQLDSRLFDLAAPPPRHKKRSVDMSDLVLDQFGASEVMKIRHSTTEKENEIENMILQSRASSHLEAIVSLLVNSAAAIEEKQTWINIIVGLVREVVASVDPNVRNGDDLDIRTYVKVKTIPGGTLEENVFVDGIVFRKNVCHKKMATEKFRPRILLLGGGIEFQREDQRLASLDTLIEQEDKYTELLVDKLMSLKPDLILVCKSVARKAQEILSQHNVVVMQNVKPQVLDRIARLTSAIMLPATDHSTFIHQYGEDCLGTCEKYYLRQVNDSLDPEEPKKQQLKKLTQIISGVTYAYIEGCPAELGCTLVLRGADRKTLTSVKRIIKFCIMMAYHLRLEVSYYMDRFACLPQSQEESADIVDVESDTNSIVPPTDGEVENDRLTILQSRSGRYLLSTSLDVDISVPFTSEIRGIRMPYRSPVEKVSPEDHQTLLVSSLLMVEHGAQRTRADVKGIRFYTKQDVSLGPFLIDTCFQVNQRTATHRVMLDNTLSFIHRTGRIDISVTKNSGDFSTDELSSRNPFTVPIKMQSYCKVCKNYMPDVLMSDETWKMSFGKFLEIMFYNRTSKCHVNNCMHSLRDDHVLYFMCEGYAARFEFTPIHPYSLHIRNVSDFPIQFHNKEIANFLYEMSQISAKLYDSFRASLSGLEKNVREVLASRPEVLSMALADINLTTQEVQQATTETSSSLQLLLTAVAGEIEHIEKLENYDNSVLLEKKKPSLDDKQIILLKYPMAFQKELVRKANLWNSKIDVVHRFIESVKSIAVQGNAVTGQTPPQSNTPDLPDDEDLMMMRQTIMMSESPMDYGAEDLDEYRDTKVTEADDTMADKPPTKGTRGAGGDDKRRNNRVSQVIARLMGKDSAPVSKYTVPLMHLSGGRLNLPPGRNGEVIAVYEEELASVIAYSLASHDYYNQLQVFLHEDTADSIDYPKNEVLSSPADFADTQGDEKVVYTPSVSEDRKRSTDYPTPTAAEDAKQNLIDPAFAEKGPGDALITPAAADALTETSAPIMSDNTLGFMTYTNDTFHDTLGYQEDALKRHAHHSKDSSADGSIPAVVVDAVAEEATSRPPSPTGEDEFNNRQNQLLSLKKSHIKLRFNDVDDKNNIVCKFIFHAFWASQFQALRKEYLNDPNDEGYLRSLSMTLKWNAKGGKSGASFSRTTDNRFVIKCITRTELQMFMDIAPAYFEYMAKAFYHGLPTVLIKILGVYQIGYHNRITGKKVMEQIVVMENLFFEVKSK